MSKLNIKKDGIVVKRNVYSSDNNALQASDSGMLYTIDVERLFQDARNYSTDVYNPAMGSIPLNPKDGDYYFNGTSLVIFDNGVWVSPTPRLNSKVVLPNGDAYRLVATAPESWRLIPRESTQYAAGVGSMGPTFPSTYFDGTPMRQGQRHRDGNVLYEWNGSSWQPVQVETGDSFLALWNTTVPAGTTYDDSTFDGVAFNQSAGTSGAVTSAVNIGTNAAIYAGISSGILQFRTVSGQAGVAANVFGNDVIVSFDPSTLTVAQLQALLQAFDFGDMTATQATDLLAILTAAGLSSSVSVANVGSGSDVYKDSVGGSINLRGLNGITGVSAVVNGDNVDVSFNTATLTPAQITALLAALTAAGLSSSVSVANVGSGSDVYKDSVGGSINLRGVNGITGVSAVVNGDNVDVSFDTATLTPAQFTALSSGVSVANVGFGADTYRDSVGGSINLRGINGATGVSAFVNGDNVDVSFNPATLTPPQLATLSSVIPVANVGSGADVYYDSVGGSINLRGVNGITGVSAVVNGDNVDVSFDTATLTPAQVTALLTALDAAGLSSAVSVANVGSGEDVYKDSVGGNINLRGLNGITGVSAVVNGDNIDVSFNTATLTPAQITAISTAILTELNATQIETNAGLIDTKFITPLDFKTAKAVPQVTEVLADTAANRGVVGIVNPPITAVVPAVDLTSDTVFSGSALGRIFTNKAAGGTGLQNLDGTVGYSATRKTYTYAGAPVTLDVDQNGASYDVVADGTLGAWVLPNASYAGQILNIYFSGTAAETHTVSGNFTGFLRNGGVNISNTSLSAITGDAVTLIGTGGAWRVQSTSVSELSGSNWKTSADGSIEAWGSVLCNAASTTVATLPITFPNANYFLTTSIRLSSGVPTGDSVYWTAPTTTQFSIRNMSPTQNSLVYYHVILNP